MSYAYEYTEGLKQFGMVHLIIKFTDSDNVLPEVKIPVVLDDSEYCEDKIKVIANEIINSFTVSNSTPVIEEDVIITETESEPIIGLDETVDINTINN